MKIEFKTDALARCLALHPTPPILIEDEPQPTAAEIEAATARLDALPEDEQVRVYCDAMGFDVLEYLRERASYNAWCRTEVEWEDQ